MPSFTVSIPEDECKLLDEEAEANDRSRAAQVRIILKTYFKMYPKLVKKEKAP